MINFLLFGARGRMGKIITEDFGINQLSQKDNSDINLLAGVECESHPDVGKFFFGKKILSDEDNFPECDVWVEFSLAEPAMRHVRLAVKDSIPVVIAATGFNEDQISEIKELASSSPVLTAPNLSIGIAVMDNLVGTASQLLGDTFNSAIVDVHHTQKKDAPSGTALKLKDRIQSGTDDKTQVVSLRIGGNVGEHQVRFSGQNEELIITHRAWSRNAFSNGVERAVRFIANQKPGLYSIQDMLQSA